MQCCFKSEATGEVIVNNHWLRRVQIPRNLRCLALYCMNPDGLISLSLMHITKRTSELSKRSEDHTSELQSLMRNSNAVFCLKKRNININHNIIDNQVTTYIT